MKNKINVIRVLLSKGRVANAFLDILVEKKLIKKEPKVDRKLRFRILNMEIMLVKSRDISLLLDNDYGDIAILGSDAIEENYKDKYVELFDFNEKKCYFALAGIPNTNIDSIKNIVTKYPNILKKYMKKFKIQGKITKMNGSLELYPNIGFCDGIVDIVETGRTLKENGLVIIKRFDFISTKIITTKENKNNESLSQIIKEYFNK